MLVDDVTNRFKPTTIYSTLALTSLSALVNVILTALIVFRLVYHRRYVRNALGVQHGSLYANVITMCVESSALMVISSGLYPILWALLWTSQAIKTSVIAEKFLFDISPHLYVGSLVLNDF